MENGSSGEVSAQKYSENAEDNDSASVIFHLQKMHLQSFSKEEDFEKFWRFVLATFLLTRSC